MTAERNPAWLPIAQAQPRSLWGSVAEMIATYEASAPRVSLTQRYSLVVVEPLPQPVWRKS